MDFLDPKKLRRHTILLFCGYVLIGIAIAISATVLVYQANGFGVNRQGEVVQNGLVFVSSTPGPADIYVNDVRNQAQTNTRLSLPAGAYKLRLTRDGYHDWNRPAVVQGGDVQTYDYPFLIPQQLTPSTVDTYQASPGLVTQSRDRRWLLVQQAQNPLTFNSYDLNQDQIADPQVLQLPSNLIRAADGEQAWEAIQWANDNEHVLLKHTYGSGYEFILLDRANPTESTNLNSLFRTAPQDITLIDNKADQFHVLRDATLSRASIAQPSLVTQLTGILAYKSFGTDLVLYATPSTTEGRTNIVVTDSARNYTLRSITAADSYSLDIATYRGDQYAVLGSSSESQVYVYKNPIDQLKQPTIVQADAVRALRVPAVSSVSFSPNTRFIVAESGSAFNVYDLRASRVHAYGMDRPLDSPRLKADWMDGSHLTYIADGRPRIFDYDDRNQHTLSPLLPQYGLFFGQDYRYAFSFHRPSSDNPTVRLQRTPLRTADDL